MALGLEIVIAATLCLAPTPIDFKNPPLSSSQGSAPSAPSIVSPSPATVTSLPVPAIFAPIAYDVGLAQTKKQGTMLVVDATSKDCPPCRKMDRTTWTDSKVLAWVKEHALAVRLDVDKERALSRSLKIDAMPTVIVYRDGQESDRAVGYQSSTELLAWLVDLQNGKKRIDAIRAKAGDRTAKRVDVHARYNLARELLRSRKLTEATDEYVWLWQNMLAHEPAMSGVRGSYMASEIERLVAMHLPARKAFEVIRAEAATKADLDDWFVLNEALGESASTLAWFDRARNDDKLAEPMHGSAFRIERLLIDSGRWADLLVLYPDPLRVVQQQHAQFLMLRSMGQNDGPELEEAHVQMFADQVSNLYAALLAAGRDQEADRVANEALRLNANPILRKALVSTALAARQPRPVHLEWTTDPALRLRVQQSLEKSRRSPR